MTKLKQLNNNNVKYVSLSILKINFLYQFGFWMWGQNDTLYMVRWIGLVLMTPQTSDYHRQTDKQTEIIN